MSANNQATADHQKTVSPQPSETGEQLSEKEKQVGGFVVEKKIGKGQFSTVYKAKDSKTGRTVALKRVPIFEMMDAKSRNDCIKEIDLLRSLNHPNVVSYYDSFIENQELVIVLDLADAGDLGKLIKHFKTQGKSMPERTIWKYFLQTASGLQHMHHRRIMHRDLKPANVFITAQGQVKLGDLGLGRFFSNNTVEAHSLVGTPYYMSPERIHETGYTFQSDIWSLGCILYELAALHSPFYDDKMTLYLLCKKIEKSDYPALSATLFSEELRTLVNAMIQVDPERRPDIDYVVEYARRMYERTSRQASQAIAETKQIGQEKQLSHESDATESAKATDVEGTKPAAEGATTAL